MQDSRFSQYMNWNQKKEKCCEQYVKCYCHLEKNVSTNKRDANANRSLGIVNGNINTSDVNASIRMTIVNGKRKIPALAKRGGRLLRS